LNKTVVETNTPIEANSDKIHVLATENPGREYSLNITAFPELLSTTFAAAVKNVSKEISIPGFRKGKAPTQLILQKYSKVVNEQWREITINAGLQEALKLLQLRPFTNDIRCPSIKEFSKEKGANFIITFEATPRIPTLAYEEITLKEVPLPAVTQMEIDKVMQDLLMHEATWEDITDRPVEMGDYVNLDLDMLDEENVITESICKDTRYIVKEGQTAPWLLKLLLGMHQNESTDGYSERPSNDSSQEPFFPTKCRVTVKAIQKPVLHVQDDLFAQRFGSESLENLQAQIRKRLELQARVAVQEALREQLDNWLRAHCTFEIPNSLLEKEQERRWQNRLAHLGRAAPSGESIEEQKRAFQTASRDAIVTQYRLQMLLLAVAETNHIEVSQEELNQAVSEEYLRKMLYVDQDDNSDAWIQEKMQLLRFQKVRDYIIEKVNIQPSAT
jgi:trigger factor